MLNKLEEASATVNFEAVSFLNALKLTFKSSFSSSSFFLPFAADEKERKGKRERETEFDRRWSPRAKLPDRYPEPSRGKKRRKKEDGRKRRDGARRGYLGKLSGTTSTYFLLFPSTRHRHRERERDSLFDGLRSGEGTAQPDPVVGSNRPPVVRLRLGRHCNRRTRGVGGLHRLLLLECPDRGGDGPMKGLAHLLQRLLLGSIR